MKPLTSILLQHKSNTNAQIMSANKFGRTKRTLLYLIAKLRVNLKGFGNGKRFTSIHHYTQFKLRITEIGVPRDTFPIVNGCIESNARANSDAPV